MSLIDHERDDDSVLEAEDAAIRDAQKGEQPEAFIPVGDDLARLIATLTDSPGEG